MALVQCPECGNMVGENAFSCPSCGTPTSKFISYCPYCELLKKKKNLMNYSKDNKIFTCPECYKIVKIATPEEEAQIEQNRKLYEIQNENKPKCPTCNSTNVKKISTMSKVAGATMFGLFSKTARSQFQCNNCGYKW